MCADFDATLRQPSFFYLIFSLLIGVAYHSVGSNLYLLEMATSFMAISFSPEFSLPYRVPLFIGKVFRHQRLERILLFFVQAPWWAICTAALSTASAFLHTPMTAHTHVSTMGLPLHACKVGLLWMLDFASNSLPTYMYPILINSTSNYPAIIIFGVQCFLKAIIVSFSLNKMTHHHI